MFSWLSSSGQAQPPKTQRKSLKYVVGRDSHAVSAGCFSKSEQRSDAEGNHRAKKRETWYDWNPVGTNGIFTQTVEILPGVSDVVRCIHTFRGENEAAERARGNSLAKYLSKD